MKWPSGFVLPVTGLPSVFCGGLCGSRQQGETGHGASERSRRFDEVTPSCVLFFMVV